MPRNQVAARRYAESLFDIARSADSKSKPQEVLEELKALRASISGNKEISKFFLNPTVSKADKLSVIEDLESKMPQTYRFLSLLIEADRLEILDEIVDEFESSVEQISGELSVELELAHQPSEQAMGEIQNLITRQWNCKPKFKTKINPKLLGGFIAKAPGRTFDASVRSQLRNLEQSLAS